MSLTWTQPEWLEGAHSWIDAELVRCGLAVTGAIGQPHVRPWSTVLCVPTSDGPLWFKANVDALAHEAAVVTVLGRRWPDVVPELLAADLASGWMLMRDGGTRMRELDGGHSHWEGMLTTSTMPTSSCATAATSSSTGATRASRTRS